MNKNYFVGVFFIALLTLAITGNADQGQPGSARALSGKLEKVIETYTAEGRLPNIVAGVANREGTIYIGASGLKNTQDATLMTPNSIVAIASMTKPVTTVAVLQLVEKGLIDLHSPITKYLPELAEIKVLKGFTEDGDMALESPSAIPTTFQLLTHTSGFVYEFTNSRAFESVKMGLVPSIFSGLAGLQAPMGFSPGARWEYGIGLDWAGVIVERVSGLTLDVYFKRHIFEPLKMSDTAYVVPEADSSRVAAIHVRTEAGFSPTPPTPPVVTGGHGLFSTVSDYLRFLRAILRGGELDGARVLQPESVAEMFNNQIGDFEVNPGRTAMPAMLKDYDFGFGAPAKWGLGFLIHEAPTIGGRPAGSVSWAGIFNSYFWIDRENGIVAMASTQLMPLYDEEAVSLLTEFEGLVYEHVGQD
ncbi:MAG TPA: 1,4-butanediol diacrylate esterase [Spongiibacteraceae bacterium]|nr:1,4-butanediol diacrylate esterase [Spongiibacteraceae bacterium]HCS28996.1 1,4-butanediol diacrylate esterase [Spongiibacteraceae bacterium]